MFTLKISASIALLSIFLLLPKQSATQKPDAIKFALADTPDVLKDTDGYRVYVTISGDLPDTFTENDVRVDVELRLRQNGIHVLTEEEVKAKPSASRLVVSISTRKSKNESVASGYTAVLQVDETMQSVRNPKMIVLGAATWQKLRSGSFDWAKTDFVRDKVKELTDKFLNDYLTANPKK